HGDGRGGSGGMVDQGTHGISPHHHYCARSKANSRSARRPATRCRCDTMSRLGCALFTTRRRKPPSTATDDLDEQVVFEPYVQEASPFAERIHEPLRLAE